MNFPSLGLAQPLLRAVEAEGYTTPTPIQLQAIPHVLAGRDVLGCAQTGTGKTAAFALPILHRLGSPAPVAPPQNGAPPRRGRRIRVLVLSPTRELAAQIGESFRTYGKNTQVKYAMVFGGVSQVPQVRALQHGVDVLIATPGRLVDLMNQGYVDLSGIETFVLDEADRMLDMGFLPDVNRIISKLPRQRQTLFFSATMPEPIARLASEILRDPAHVKIAPVKATTALIEHSVYHVAQVQKPQLLAALLGENPAARTIVFTRTKHGADKVVKQLARENIRAEAIHGNKSQNQRQRALGAFKANKLPVLVATDLAARGLDVDGITHVINYDVPHEPETYVHRSGRTGRAGATGLSISFCNPEERRSITIIERLMRTRIRVEAKLPASMAELKPTKVEEGPVFMGREKLVRPQGGSPRASDGRPHRGQFAPGAKRKERRQHYASRI